MQAISALSLPNPQHAALTSLKPENPPQKKKVTKKFK